MAAYVELDIELKDAQRQIRELQAFLAAIVLQHGSSDNALGYHQLKIERRLNMPDSRDLEIVYELDPPSFVLRLRKE